VSLTSTERDGVGETNGPIPFLGAVFEEGSEPAMHTKPKASDLQEITAAVRDARQEADWVIVSIHAHEGAPGNREIPAEFLVTFAHAVIDAGADMMVGHGPHVLRAIEIYHRKPIFYSLGDFIFENETVRFQPAENYESVGLPPTALPSDFFNARSKNDTISYPADQFFWEGMMAEPVFDKNRELQSIKVYPLELGFKQSRMHRGRPHPASEPKAKEILARLAKLSEPFGTKVNYDQGTGTLSWKESEKTP
ncbi:MAG TPA: CapA family protein, partial [Opitutaceae bacterium]|nr:CapA family protein [Opitutaceae bacterium]